MMIPSYPRDYLISLWEPPPPYSVNCWVAWMYLNFKHYMNIVFSFGPLSTRNPISMSEEENWHCLAWRNGGSGETLLLSTAI